MSKRKPILAEEGGGEGRWPALLSIMDLAEYLSVSVRLIETWRQYRRLPDPIELGARVTRWRRTDIDRWIRERKPKR